MWEILHELGVLFRGPYNKDHTILGSILGPLFMETAKYWTWLTRGYITTKGFMAYFV